MTELERELLEALKNTFQAAALFNHDGDSIWDAIRDQALTAIKKGDDA